MSIDHLMTLLLEVRLIQKFPYESVERELTRLSSPVARSSTAHARLNDGQFQRFLEAVKQAPPGRSMVDCQYDDAPIAATGVL